MLRIINGSQVLISGVRALVMNDNYVDDHSAGVKEIGALRPGTMRFIIHLKSTGGSAGGNWMLNRDLYQNRLVEWVEFTDSSGRVWRRQHDGQLVELSGRDRPPVQ